MCLSVIIISSNTLGPTFMNITYLQKLDFLLKIVNAYEDSKSYKIIFGFKGQTFKGDFVPNNTHINVKLRQFKIKLLDINNLDEENKFKIVDSSNSEWKSLWTHHSGDLFQTDLGTLFTFSSELDANDYLLLLDEILEAHPVEFNPSLPTYIYNVKSLATQLPINFMKIDENTKFDFISIVPENTI